MKALAGALLKGTEKTKEFAVEAMLMAAESGKVGQAAIRAAGAMEALGLLSWKTRTTKKLRKRARQTLKCFTHRGQNPPQDPP